MKKQFQTSYRLGITAGILTGLLSGVLAFIVLQIFAPQEMPDTGLLSTISSFFSALLTGVSSFIFLGILFIALINILPSSSIFIKFFIMEIILTVVSLPFYFLFKQFSLVFLISNTFLSLLIEPMLFSYFYKLIARRFIGVTKFSKIGFTFLVGLLLIILFANSMAFAITGVLNAASSKIDEAALEKEVFNQINQKRAEFGNKPVLWDDKIYAVAKSYSTELANGGTFSHISDKGESIDNRLSKANVYYYIAGENLAFMPINTKDMAQGIVEMWMNSPGHRSLIVDRDKFFSHGAVGIKCSNLFCYSALDLVGFIINGKIALGEWDFYSINLNDASLGLSGEYPVRIDIKATIPMDIYLFGNIDQAKLFFKYNEDHSKFKRLNTKELSFKTKAKKDSYLLFLTKEDSSTISYTITYN